MGDGPDAVELGGLSLRAMLQARYTTTFAEPSTNRQPGYALREDYLVRQGDGWSLNRLFLRLQAAPVEYLGFKAIVDFSELLDNSPRTAVKQAHVTLTPIPEHLQFIVGLFKRPYSVLELDPIAKYEFADVGPSDSLAKRLGFAGNDLGAQMVVSPFSKSSLLHAMIGIFRGNTEDEQARLVGAWGARLESHPIKGIRIGASMIDHPYPAYYLRPFSTSSRDIVPTAPDPFFPAQRSWGAGRAFAADVTYKRFGWHARAEGMYGDRVDLDTRYGAQHFASVWASVSYRFRLAGLKLMPGARAEWLDADWESPTGARRMLSGAVTLILSKMTRFSIDVTRTDVEPGTIFVNQPRPLPSVPFLDVSNTRVVGQMQFSM